MKINKLVIFSLIVIVIIMLSAVESRNEKKNKKDKKIKKSMMRMVSESLRPDVNAWKRDKFMSQLKDEPKYKKSANSTNKWTLFNYLIGKTLTYLGIQADEAAKYVKSLSQPKAFKIVVLLMKFQKSMDFNTLAPMVSMKIPGLTSANFLPLGRQKVLNFLTRHIRVRPSWGRGR